jgi:endonuclease YncB( thermonuclease family)
MSGDSVEVRLILNGDEFVVEHDRLRAKVRMIGIKAFDPVVSEREITAFGDGAVSFLQQWILNKTVQLEFDEPKQDEQGCYLGYVFLDGIDINQRMVAEGIAMVYTEFSTTHEQDYLMAEIPARRARKGIWGGSKARARVMGLRREWSRLRVLQNGEPPVDPLLGEEQ